MHIVLAVLSAVAAVAFFIIRAGMVAQAGREIGEAASDIAGAARRRKFRKSSTRSPLTQLSDPREAVAALMVAIAKTEGDLTDRQIKAMEGLVENRLEYSPGSDLIARARWMTQEAVEPGTVVQRVSRYLANTCDEEQKSDVIEILTTVASLNGEPSPLQTQAIQQLRASLDMRGTPH